MIAGAQEVRSIREMREVSGQEVEEVHETEIVAEEPVINDEEIVIPESYKYAIVMTVPMEFIENSHAPTPIEVTSNMGYARMHVIAGTVAEFIRGLGWNAIPMGNDTALSVPMAAQAGLGHVGRNGRLIT